MGGLAKGLLTWEGEPFAARLASVMRPFVSRLAISANRNHDLYRAWADAVLDDAGLAGEGPLAGLLRGLAWARDEGKTGLITAPCDTPRLTAAWAERLCSGLGNPDQALICRVAGRWQPLHAYLPVSSLAVIEQRFGCGERRAGGLMEWLDARACDCDDLADQFWNLNRPEDWEAGQ